MNSLILKTITRLLLVLMLIFSLLVLFRGHNFPGGGFIAGLLAASALAIYLLAYGLENLLKIIRFSPLFWISLGLIFILSSGFWGWFSKGVFLSGVWPKRLSLFNTSLLFDLGIYLIVCFSVLTILIELEKAK